MLHVSARGEKYKREEEEVVEEEEKNEEEKSLCYFINQKQDKVEQEFAYIFEATKYIYMNI